MKQLESKNRQQKVTDVFRIKERGEGDEAEENQQPQPQQHKKIVDMEDMFDGKRRGATAAEQPASKQSIKAQAIARQKAVKTMLNNRKRVVALLPCPIRYHLPSPSPPVIVVIATLCGCVF